MWLDTSDLESFAPLSGSIGDLCVELTVPPSFDLPISADKDAEGTTTLAFIFDEGVIVAADSRASMGGCISSQTDKKIIEISPYMLGTMAGGAVDRQFWHKNLSIKCRLYELENERRMSVAGASNLLEIIMYSYHRIGLSVETMIAGWDEKGPSLYYVDTELGRLKGDRFSMGSGSSYADGVLGDGYRKNMTIEEAAELARRAIYHATFRDGASGGVASDTVYYIGPGGWKKLSGDDVSELH